jgi:hypothetical protein
MTGAAMDLTGAAKRMEAAQSSDPVTFEVIRNALQAAAEEMSVSLQRTAFSTNVEDASRLLVRNI